MTPDLNYYWEGARKKCEDHKWDGQIYIRIYIYILIHTSYILIVLTLTLHICRMANEIIIIRSNSVETDERHVTRGKPTPPTKKTG